MHGIFNDKGWRPASGCSRQRKTQRFCLKSKNLLQSLIKIQFLRRSSQHPSPPWSPRRWGDSSSPRCWSASAWSCRTSPLHTRESDGLLDSYSDDNLRSYHGHVVLGAHILNLGGDILQTVSVGILDFGEKLSWWLAFIRHSRDLILESMTLINDHQCFRKVKRKYLC